MKRVVLVKERRGPSKVLSLALQRGDVTDTQLSLKSEAEEETGAKRRSERWLGKRASTTPRKVFCMRPPSQLGSEESPTDGRVCCSVRGVGEERSPHRTADGKGKQNQEAEEKVTKKKGA